MINRLKNKLHRDENGQGLVEYALIIAVLCLGALAALSTVSTDMQALFSQLDSALTSFSSGS